MVVGGVALILGAWHLFEGRGRGQSDHVQSPFKVYFLSCQEKRKGRLWTLTHDTEDQGWQTKFKSSKAYKTIVTKSIKILQMSL